MRYHKDMKKTRFVLRLTALLAALCLLAGCALPSAEEAGRLLDELEALEAQYGEYAGPAEAPPDESPAAAPEPEQAAEPEPEPESAPAEAADEPADDAPPVDPEGSYTTKEAVAAYLRAYGRLPRNFITKSEARALGWSGGGLDPYAPGMSIGGDRFGNYEGLLPDAPGREYRECDIDTAGAASRGAKRIVYSNDGLIYYTDDHYESFTLLYPED